MDKRVVEIKNLHKYFESGSSTLKVIKGLHLEINRGEIIGIVGESGVGKSTLLSLIGGIDSVTSGSIKIKETVITDMSEDELNKFRADYIGFMFQYHFLLPEFNSLENVMLPLLIKGGKERVDVERIKKLLNQVGLESRIYHKPDKLSGGECQRVALCRAVVKNPEIVIADEPTGNLDDKNTDMIFKFIEKLNKKYNTTFIIATHNMKIREIASKVYELKNGVLGLV